MDKHASITLRSIYRWRACALVLGLIVLSAAPARGEDVFTPHHVAKLRTVTSAEISPDGTRVAYTLSVPRQPLKNDEDGPGWVELHVVGENGAARPFVTGQVNVSNVAWTPDGQGISFLAKRGSDKHKALYMISSDGGEARRVLAHDTDITAYSWSPDGKHVAFLATEAVVEAKKKIKDKGFSQEIYEEDWQPVRVWTADTEKADKPRALNLPGSASELHWSPAGPRLVVALALTPLVDDDYMKRKVHVVNADTGEVVARLENSGKLGKVAWSPDGKHLALIAAADENDTAAGRLMVASASGGPLRDLLPEYKGHVHAIAWRDPDTILFVGDEGVWSTVSQIQRDGSQRKILVPVGGPVLLGLTVSREGRSAALVGQSPQHPSEVFFTRFGQDEPRRLSNSNPWLANLRWAPQEVVSFKARDGLRLEGILIRPLNEEKGKRYPLVLTVHGGPEAHYRNGWLTGYSDPGQTFAAHGFAVFYPNYRGSTGRGVAFAKSSQGDPAGKEFNDLVDAVDHLIGSGLVDPKRVGITGGSYGGYATAWGATYYSDRFAAGVMFVGISDQISKAGTTDIPNEMYLVHERHWPWEDWNLFRERSPIYHVQKAHTPLLILAGKNDPRVNPGQSLELYRYLKLQGRVPVRLVYYPGEGHGNQRAASRLDYSLRLLQWMEHYLKGPGGAPPPYELDYGTAEGAESGAAATTQHSAAR